MNIFVDIDETICRYVDDRHYPHAIPIQENIDKINQLEKWGCKHHELSVGEKPGYDLLICDKTKRIEEI